MRIETLQWLTHEPSNNSNSMTAHYLSFITIYCECLFTIALTDIEYLHGSEIKCNCRQSRLLLFVGVWRIRECALPNFLQNIHYKIE